MGQAGNLCNIWEKARIQFLFSICSFVGRFFSSSSFLDYELDGYALRLDQSNHKIKTTTTTYILQISKQTNQSTRKGNERERKKKNTGKNQISISCSHFISATNVFSNRIKSRLFDSLAIQYILWRKINIMTTAVA